VIQINEIGYKQGIVDILELCNKAKSKVSMRVDKKSCRNEIDALKQRRFSGVVKLISDFEEILSTQIIVFDSGKIKLFFIKESQDIQNYDIGDGKGVLEIYECSSVQIKKVYRMIGEANTPRKISEEKSVKPYSVREIEKILEAYKAIKEYGKVEAPKEIEETVYTRTRN
jgi:hypothetical protein